jgi:hypothetical protein
MYFKFTEVAVSSSFFTHLPTPLVGMYREHLRVSRDASRETLNTSALELLDAAKVVSKIIIEFCGGEVTGQVAILPN